MRAAVVTLPLTDAIAARPTGAGAGEAEAVVAGQPNAGGSAARWGLLAWALAAAVVVVVVTEWVWADIWRLSSGDEEASHVMLVPLAVLWLAWVRKSRFAGCKPTGRYVGTALLALGWAMWSLGYRRNVQTFWHLGAIVMVVGAVLTVLGKDVLLRFAPAFAVLVFLMPVPATGRQLISLPLQHYTAQATQSVGEVLGMDILRHGNMLTVNGKEVAIAEACNGMRMVFTLFLAVYVFAFVTPLRPWVRALLLVASPVIAIGANVIRMLPTVWMYGNASTSAADMFHDVGGWAMLVLAFLLLLGMAKAARWATGESDNEDGGDGDEDDRVPAAG